MGSFKRLFRILEDRKHDIFNEDSNLKSSTSDIWKDLSLAVDGRKTSIPIYLDITTDIIGKVK